MKITILGCGTSSGVPLIGCPCEVCRSTNPKNKRTRSSVLLSNNGKNILIDTSTDLRYQSLKNRVNHIDAVLYTHSHADHIHGIDDMRAFNFASGALIPCYGNKNTVNTIKNIFQYLFHKNPNGSAVPLLEFRVVDSPFNLHGITIIPVPVLHGSIPILGYRIGNMAYITDCSHIPEQSEKMLKNLDLLILDSLRHKPHPTHFNIEKAIEVSKGLHPQRTVFTHLTHDLDYEKTNRELPLGMELAYDGMMIEV
jgi:phosphoribosyl 1,2-cyclic phosphate phosphodiesterase